MGVRTRPVTSTQMVGRRPWQIYHSRIDGPRKGLRGKLEPERIIGPHLTSLTLRSTLT